MMYMCITKATCERAIIYTQSYTKKIGWGFIVHTYKYIMFQTSVVVIFSPGLSLMDPVIANAILY